MDPLHEIVQSLNKAEKRYFRMFAEAFKTGSDLMKLYDCLEAMEEYDETVVEKKVKAKNLTSLKSQLRKLVLKAMRNYREDDNIGDRVRCALSEIEFLTNKNLRSEARKEINKLTKLVNDAELHYAIGELAMRSALNAEPEKDKEKMFAFFDERIEELNYAAQGMVEMYGSVLFQSKNARYFNAFDYDKPEVRKENLLKALEEAETRAKTCRSLRARLMYLMAAAGYCSSLRRMQQARQLFEECLQLFDEHPELYESPKTFFFTVMANYMAFAVSEDDVALMEALIARLENWMLDLKEYFAVNHEIHLRVRVRILATQIGLYHLTKNMAGMEAAEPELEYMIQNTKFVESQHSLIPLMAMRMAATYLTTGNLNKAEYWAEKYFALPTAKLVKLSYQIVRFIEVLIFYGRGDYNLSDTKAVNLYKTIAEAESNDLLYKEWGRFLRKLNKWNLKLANDLAECKGIIHAIEKMNDEQQGNAPIFWNTINLNTWLQSVPANR